MTHWLNETQKAAQANDGTFSIKCSSRGKQLFKYVNEVVVSHEASHALRRVPLSAVDKATHQLGPGTSTCRPLSPVNAT